MSNSAIKAWLRSLTKDQLLLTINLASFLIGIGSVILIFSFVYKEYTFDEFHEGSSKIFRLTSVFTKESKEIRYAINEGRLDFVLETQVPGIASSTAFTPAEEMFFVHNDEHQPNSKGLYADDDFLNTFDFALLAGNRKECLKRPDAIILSRRSALALFGTTDILNETLQRKTSEGFENYLISGVLADIPKASSLQFDFIIKGSGEMWEEQFVENAGNTMHIFFRMQNAESQATVQEKVNRAFAKTISNAQGILYRTPIERLQDLHFSPRSEFDIVEPASKKHVQVIFLIGLGILLISIINYVNFIAGRATERYQEIGVRKALGASRHQISIQFMLENILYFSVSAVCAFFLDVLLLNLLPAELGFDHHGALSFNIFLIVILSSVSIGAVTALYPALYMNRFPISEILHGRNPNSPRGEIRFKSAITMLQIVVSISVLAFGLTIVKHLQKLRTESLGYKKENVIYFIRPADISSTQWLSFTQELEIQTATKKVAGSFYPLLSSMNNAQFRMQDDKSFTCAWNLVTFDFIETMDMELIQGRAFDRNFPSDSAAMVINKTAADIMGGDVLGKKISFWKGEFEIIGVIEDFRFQSFSTAAQPVAFALSKTTPRMIYARTSEINTDDVFSMSYRSMEAAKFDRKVDVMFFDDWFDTLIKKELQLRDLIIYFIIVSLFVTVAGVFVLTRSTGNHYRKQIGIRKIHGADSGDVFLLLTKRILVALVLAFIPSVPIFFYATDFWMSNFAHKIEVNVWDLIIAFVLILLIVIMIVIKQLRDSTSEKPIDSLRMQ